MKFRLFEEEGVISFELLGSPDANGEAEGCRVDDILPAEAESIGYAFLDFAKSARASIAKKAGAS